MYNPIKSNTMTNLNNLLDKLASNQQVQSHLVKAKEAYEQKPFTLEYQKPYEAICKFSWVPSLLSIVSSSLVAVSIFPKLNIFLSLAIGLTLAIGLEILKGFATKLGFRSWFKAGSLNLILLASILLYCISIGLSSLGAMNGYQMIGDNLKNDVSSHVAIESDSLATHYQNAIKEAQDKAKQYFSSVSWKNKISHKNAITYNKLIDKVATLENDYKASLEALRGEEVTRIAKTDEQIAPYLFLLIGFALLNEAVIFFFARFREYYLFKSNQQVEQISQAEVLTINLDSLQNLGQLLQLSGSDSRLVLNSNSSGSIGFQSGNREVEKQPVHSPLSTTGSSEPDKLAPRKCVNCSTVYKPSVAWQKFCSKSCNHVANDFKLKK